MTIWWESLTLLERAAACIAVPATLVLLIQTVLLLFGLGGSDAGLDTDVDGDGAPDALGAEHADGADTGLRVFTVRGFVAFFAVFGWGVLALSRSGLSQLLSVLAGVTLGVAAMVLTGAALWWVLRLQSDGTADYRNAIGASGRVYLTVPPRREGRGKVNVLVQEQLRECDAVTDEEAAVETGCEVVITGLSGQDTLVIRRKKPV